MYVSIYTVIEGCCRKPTAGRKDQAGMGSSPARKQTNAWLSLCQAPQPTVKAGCRCSAEPRTPHLSAEHTRQPPSKHHSPPMQGFLQVLCLQVLPLLELSLQHLPGKVAGSSPRQRSPGQAVPGDGCSRGRAGAPAHGQGSPLLRGQPSPRPATPHPALLLPLIPF